MWKDLILLVNHSFYLHVQGSDDGIDYSMYQRDTWELIDGGILTLEEWTSGREVILTILQLHDIRLGSISIQPLVMLERFCESE